MADLVGAHVTLTGLTEKPELNGRRGKVFSFSAVRGRVGVAIEGMEPFQLELIMFLPVAAYLAYIELGVPGLLVELAIFLPVVAYLTWIGS